MPISELYLFFVQLSTISFMYFVFFYRTNALSRHMKENAVAAVAATAFATAIFFFEDLQWLR